MRARLALAATLATACAASTPPAVAPISDSPHVLITRDHVSVDGDVVGDASGSATLEYVDGLGKRLRERYGRGGRDAWIDVQAGGSPKLFAAVVLTTGFAGFVRQHLRAGGDWTLGEFAFEPPPLEERATRTRLVLAPRHGLVHAVWQSGRPCDAVPEDADVSLSDLPRYLARSCASGGACIQARRNDDDAGPRRGVLRAERILAARLPQAGGRTGDGRLSDDLQSVRAPIHAERLLVDTHCRLQVPALPPHHGSLRLATGRERSPGTRSRRW
jgi:hypothetical protein